ncbi:hypothetical protein BSKO_10895 [Bryopsis sp. KO-2023]|nr:hypothetical protein BSKO_10895 [Bryopsis sp. KO-2023]
MWPELPHDLLCSIVDRMDQNKDWKSMGLVCSHWDKAVSLATHSVAVDHQRLHAIEWDRYPCLLDLHVELAWVDGLTFRSLRHAKSLKRLHLDSCHLGSFHLPHITNLANISEVCLSGCSGINNALRCFRALKGLKKLVIRYSDLMDSDMKWIKLLSGLEHLDLTGSRGLTDRALKTIGNMTQLNTLNLAECSGVSDNGIRWLHSMTCMTHLDVSNCWEVTDAGFATIGQIKTLRSFRAMDLQAVSDEGIRELEGLVNLTELDIQSSFSLGLGDSACESLAKLKALVFLNLGTFADNDFTVEGLKLLEFIPYFSPCAENAAVDDN